MGGIADPRGVEDGEEAHSAGVLRSLASGASVWWN